MYKVALIILFLAYYVDWLHFITWSIWYFHNMFGFADHCFINNPLFMKLFGAIESRDLDQKTKVPPTLMAEIQAQDYSFEALRVISQDWRQPVLVRGLFLNSSAIAKWRSVDYLIDIFGSNDTSVIQNGTISHTYERLCATQRFGFEFSKEQAFDATLRRIATGLSTETIVFPPASRSKRVRNAPLERAWNRIVDGDLDLRRLGGTFADGVSNTVLTQMFLGNGAEEESGLPTVGTSWHCDICNNWIVQISGVKRWIMVDPKYSAFMRPMMNNGKTAIAGGHITLLDNLPHFPHHVVDLQPGDFLYNPEWYWHSIENSPSSPYSFGLVSRQCHMARNFRSNAIFTSMIVWNHMVASFYDAEARQRAWSFFSGSTLMKPEDAVTVAKDRESGGYFSK